MQLRFTVIENDRKMCGPMSVRMCAVCCVRGFTRFCVEEIRCRLASWSERLEIDQVFEVYEDVIVNFA